MRIPHDTPTYSEMVELNPEVREQPSIIYDALIYELIHCVYLWEPEKVAFRNLTTGALIEAREFHTIDLDTVRIRANLSSYYSSVNRMKRRLIVLFHNLRWLIGIISVLNIFFGWIFWPLTSVLIVFISLFVLFLLISGFIGWLRSSLYINGRNC